LRKADLLLLIEKIARKLATWKALLLTQSGRLILIKSVLTAIAVYHILSLDLPPWVLDCINKICRSFFWHGSKEARGGQCLVAWNQVCKPLNLGGLGIHNLKVLNDALRMRWRWLEREGQLRSWHGLEFSISPEAEDTFQAACQCVVGVEYISNLP
jgi:hypothetical protein